MVLEASYYIVPPFPLDIFAITPRQRKGSTIACVPCSVLCTGALRELLDSKSPLVLTTPSGRACTRRYFNEHPPEASIAAGITDLHDRDRRGSAVTVLAQAGCTVPENHGGERRESFRVNVLNTFP